jgi:hypothetical protein
MAGAAGAALAVQEGAKNSIQTNNAAVSVRFENPPAGTRIKTKSGGADLDVYTGLAFP